MLSVAPVRSAAGAAKYFSKDDFVSGEYYTDEKAGDVSLWGGAGAAAIGLTGAVTQTALKDVLEGQLPGGMAVDDRVNRRAGVDLTFSAPKSVSIMAYVAGDKRILGKDGAHTAAVQKTMAWVEKNLAQARKTVDGKTTAVDTGNLVYALFQHDTSRALDPQAHIHAIIANMTKGPDGEWQALHADRIWSSNSVIGAIYHAYLRAELGELGYQTELTGKHGTFEIVGVPKAVIDANSQRRADILAAAERLGIKSSKGLREVTSRTRDPKLAIDDRDNLLQQWIDKAAALGFDGKDLLEAALLASRPREDMNPLKRGAHAIGEAVRNARETLSGLMRSPDPLVDRSIVRLAQSVGAANSQFAVASAVRHHGQREAAFEVDQIAKTALDFGLKGVTIDHVTARVERLVEQGKLLAGQIRVNGALVDAITTPEALAGEQRIIAHMESEKGNATPMVPAADAPARLQAVSPKELNAGQLAAAAMIVSSPDRSIVVQGVAGAGKTTMLQAVAPLAADEGKRILGLSPANKMVNALREEVGLEAQTVASFIWENERHVANPRTPEAQAKRAELSTTTIVVDEASMVSNDDMLKVMLIAAALGVEKTAWIGDKQQLLPVDWGKGLAMVQAAGATTVRMDQNIRQRTDQLRTVAALANIGQAAQALRVLGDDVVEHENPVEEAAERWLAMPAADRASTAIFASGRTTRAEINNLVQAGLSSEGTLTGEALTVTVHEGTHATREALRHASTYTAALADAGRDGGEGKLWLRVTGQVQEVGLKRGLYEVSGVLKNGRVELQGPSGRVRFDPRRIDPMAKRDRLELSTTKDIQISAGDAIRWTENDKGRGIHNSAQATVTGIQNGAVSVRLASGDTLTLGAADPMLARLDLAYALNMHQAQGVTADRAIEVLLSYERNLSNQRLFNVGVTRVRDGIQVITDNIKQLSWQLERNAGDKTSSLESLGYLDIDSPAARSGAADDALSAAVAMVDEAESKRIILPDLGHLGDAEMPPIGPSDNDWSKHEPMPDFSDHQDSKRWDEWRDDPAEIAARGSGDDLTISRDDKHDLSIRAPTPSQMRDRQLPGLPEKNLNLDL